MRPVLRFLMPAVLVCVLTANGIAQTNFFKALAPTDLPEAIHAPQSVQQLKSYRLDEAALRKYLRKAPLESQGPAGALPLEIPLPNGQTETFGMLESPILSPEVAAQNPDIRTYTGNGLHNKKALIRLSLTSEGFDAIILNVEGDAVYFQKYAKPSKDLYFNYFTRDVVVPEEGIKHKSCGAGLLKDAPSRMPPPNTSTQQRSSMSDVVTLKTFRLAMAANGEFTARHGGTQSGAFATVVGYVNRMTALYRNELGVSFTLVSGTNLIYTDAATDPYDNDDQILMLTQNHNNCDAEIGNANYDLGHVWGYTGGSGGGIAGFEVVCYSPLKGEGVSGEGNLASYAQVFMDQLLFHEVGHQFGMSHSYNSSIPVCTTREASTSVEPGAGTTIMSYGFTCGTDDYFKTTAPRTGPILQFHAANLAQANAYMANPIPGYGNCYSPTVTNNHVPVITMPGAYTIPKSTPFALTGSATDEDGDVLSYCWEGTDVGVIEPDANTLADLTQPPFFRSYGLVDSSGPTRYYPLLSAILNGSNYAKGDKLPSVGIATHHRLTVRDNNAAAGGVSYGDVTITVDGNIGPFLITSNLSGSYAGLSSQTITWSVNGTNAATPNVKILLSTDGGLTFPTTLAASTANDGSQAVTLPNVSTTTARIKVEAEGNIFFDISNSNFTITAVSATTCPSNSTVCLNAAPFNLTGGTPAGGVYSGPGVSGGMFDPAAAGSGTHTITYTNGTACTFSITVNAVPSANAGPDQPICSSATATLAATATNGTGAWTVTSGPSTASSQFSNTGSATAVFTPAGGPGAYTLRWTVSNAPCPAATDEVIITVSAGPASNAGSDNSICATGTATLAATATNGTGAWTVTSGPSTASTQFSNTGSATAVFTPAGGAGAYTLRWTVSNAPCPAATDEVVITVNAAPSANAGPDQPICSSATATLAATATNGAGAWTVTSGPSTASSQFSNTGSATAVFTPAGGPGAYTLRWTVSNAPCPAATDEVIITVSAGPASNAGSDNSICATGTATLAATATNGTGAWTVTSGPSTASTQFSNTGSATAIFTPAGGAGAYTLRWTVSNAPCPAATDEVVITVSAVPMSNAGPDQPICINATATLAATVANGTGAWTVTSGPSTSTAQFSNTGLATAVFTPAGGTGTYTLRWTVSNAPCPAATDEVIITVNALPVMSCPGSSSVCLTDPAFALSGASPAGGTYSGTGVSSGTFTPSVAGIGTHIITYAYTNGNNCTNTCTYTIGVTSCAVGTDLSGRIVLKRDNTSGVKDANVVLSGDQSAGMLTPLSGNYSFTGLTGSNFGIRPVKNINKLNGVNAADLTRIQQHLSGNLITDPWQLIAADVNSNNAISALDVNIVQLSLLGNPSALAQFSKSWRFVPQTHTMSNPPWGFPENISLSGVSGTVNNLDFWGIKVGDLVADYANPANSSGETWVLSTRDEILTKGRVLTVDVSGSETRDLAAFQLALYFDPAHLQLTDIQSLGGLPMTEDHFGAWQADQGSVRVVWSAAEGRSLTPQTPLFRLQFAVLEGGPALSEVLRLDPETLAAQVYGSDLTGADVSLRFETVTDVQAAGTDKNALQLLQNQPNPFVRQTTVAFVLPKACEAQIRIVDAAGRIVAAHRQQYAAGRQAEVFDLNRGSGVYYCELTTPFGVLVRKMVAID